MGSGGRERGENWVILRLHKFSLNFHTAFIWSAILKPREEKKGVQEITPPPFPFSPNMFNLSARSESTGRGGHILAAKMSCHGGGVRTSPRGRTYVLMSCNWYGRRRGRSLSSANVKQTPPQVAGAGFNHRQEAGSGGVTQRHRSCT